MDRITGYEPVDPGSIPGGSAIHNNFWLVQMSAWAYLQVGSLKEVSFGDTSYDTSNGYNFRFDALFQK